MIYERTSNNNVHSTLQINLNVVRENGYNPTDRSKTPQTLMFQLPDLLGLTYNKRSRLRAYRTIIFSM
jgi:hypothetical protein